MSDTTARDQLAKLVLNRDEWDAADTILEAGWRPPARTVSTVEELDALVAHTVVRYCTRYGWGTAEKVACDRWWPAGVVVYLTNTHVLHHGPATVLYEPEEGQ